MATSYEIICAEALRAPKKAYLELLAHPASIIPYTPNDEITKTNKTPTSTSTKEPKLVYGIRAQLAKLRTKVSRGAKLNKNLFALIGTIISFTNNFKPSAKGCNKPQKPTTLGPRLRWIAAITFLSNKVK